MGGSENVVELNKTESEKTPAAAAATVADVAPRPIAPEGTVAPLRLLSNFDGVEYLTVRQLDAWLRALPPSAQVDIKCDKPPRRSLITFDHNDQQQHPVVDDTSADFNNVDFDACEDESYVDVGRVLVHLDQPLALRPDACVTVDRRLAKPVVHLRRFAGVWRNTALNSSNLRCASLSLDLAMFVSEINRLQLNAVGVANLVAETVARDVARLVPDLPSASARTTELVANRVKSIDPLFRVGDRWYTGSGLEASFPTLAEQTQWMRLFAPSRVPGSDFLYYDCRIGEPVMSLNFATHVPLVERLLLMHSI
ncbi:Hypothetical protein UVM_LOCUS170 [uncultured virus]|nr:Hypothetical protein UVM_LOCUS170 [uncultured virus]